MIGVDWGTSSFRAYRLAPDGAILDRLEDPGGGILSVPEGGFSAALEGRIGRWLEAAAARGTTEDILLCGMVGSRQGWAEAPYLPCPAGAADIAAAALPLPFAHAGAGRARLVPGVTTTGTTGVPDVMRGEETQLAGLVAALGDRAAALACLPGSHSKWARIEDGRIAAFSTHMTGEAFAALSGHTILARTSRPGPTVPEAFARGVRRGAWEDGGLLHHAFGARTLHLTGRLADTETASYLSGLLIGHEIRAALGASGAPADPVHLIGGTSLAALYAQALALLGIPHRTHDPDLAAHGLALIARETTP